mmetsp:Transcript_5726/g.16986  ORF Transcript_5726/g.16986 Transcript_5726/m.16986 type:complete len:203 (-) Transcript_5726:1086-1694(-)
MARHEESGRTHSLLLIVRAPSTNDSALRSSSCAFFFSMPPSTSMESTLDGPPELLTTLTESSALVTSFSALPPLRGTSAMSGVRSRDHSLVELLEWISSHTRCPSPVDSSLSAFSTSSRSSSDCARFIATHAQILTRLFKMSLMVSKRSKRSSSSSLFSHSRMSMLLRMSRISSTLAANVAASSASSMCWASLRWRKCASIS